MISNVSVNVRGISGKQRRGPFTAASLAVLIAAVLSGCSVTPDTSKTQLQKALVKQDNTYVVRHASVRTPGADQTQKHQQQAEQTKQASVQHVGNGKGLKPLTSAQYHARYKARKQAAVNAQYHARYKAEQQAAAKAALKKRQAKDRKLAAQQQARQQAIRQQYVTRWEQQELKRREYTNNWKNQQARQAAAKKKAIQAAHHRQRPAAPVKPYVKPQPRPAAVAQLPGREIYLARWERMQAQKRLDSKKAAQKVERVIHNAEKQIGRKYVWGGASPRRGFDCSGLVQHSIKQGANVSVPRTAAQQYKAAIKVPKHKAERGDLVFFITHGKSVSHVGIYLGNNKFVHAPRTGKRVTTSNLSSYWKKRFVGFGRIPGACRLPI